MGAVQQTEPSDFRRYTTARILLVCSAVGFAMLWAILWVPALVTGGEGSLLLYPLVLLLAVVPFGGACSALVLAIRSRDAGHGSRGDSVAGLSAVLLALGPVLLWFGPVVG